MKKKTKMKVSIFWRIYTKLPDARIQQKFVPDFKESFKLLFYLGFFLQLQACLIKPWCKPTSSNLPGFIVGPILRVCYICCGRADLEINPKYRCG